MKKLLPLVFFVLSSLSFVYAQTDTINQVQFNLQFPGKLQSCEKGVVTVSIKNLTSEPKNNVGFVTTLEGAIIEENGFFSVIPASDYTSYKGEQFINLILNRDLNPSETVEFNFLINPIFSEGNLLGTVSFSGHAGNDSFDNQESFTLPVDNSADSLNSEIVLKTALSDFCLQTTAQLEYSGNSENTTLQWIRNNSILFGENSSILSTETPGTYQLLVINEGCASSTNTIQLYESPKAFLSLTDPLGGSVICENSSAVSLKASTYSNFPLSVRWFYYNSNFEAKTLLDETGNETIKADKAGWYEVYVTNSFGCNAFSRIQVIDHLETVCNPGICAGEIVLPEISNLNGVIGEFDVLHTASGAFPEVSLVTEACTLKASACPVFTGEIDKLAITQTGAGNCAMYNAQFQATEYNIQGEYSWSLNGNVIQNSTGSNANFSGLSNGDIVFCTFRPACESLSELVSESVIIQSGITVNAGPDKIVCAGQAVEIGSSAIAGINYHWTNANLLSDSAAAQTFATVNETTTFILTGYNEYGCIATDTVTVMVMPIPVVAMVDINVCKGNTVSFPVTSDITIYKNEVVFPGKTFYADTTTEFVVRIGNQFGCSYTDTFKVIVNEIPVADAGEDVFTCASSDAPVFIGTRCQKGLQYQWLTTYAMLDGNETLSIAGVHPQTTSDYILQVISDKGCVSYDTVKVNVINPVAPYTIQGPDQICDNASNLIYSVPFTFGSSFEWNVIGASIISGQGSNTIVIDAGKGVNQIIVKIQEYSFAPCPVSAASKTIAVLGSPVLNAGIDLTACKGNSVTLEANYIADVTYIWLPLNQNKRKVTFTADHSSDYVVFGTSVNGCAGTDTVHVTVNAAPIGDAGADQVICKGTDALLSTVFDSTYTYSWKNSNNEIIAATNQVYVTPAATYTRYFVEVKSQEGCSTIDMVSVKVQRLSVVLDGPSKVCVGTEITFIAKGLPQNSSIIWSLSAGTIISQTENSITFKVTNSTPVELKATYKDCSGTNATIREIIYPSNHCHFIGNETIKTNSLTATVYPNPAVNEANLLITSAENETVLFDVIDMNGNILISDRVAYLNTPVTFGNELNAGIYVVRVKEGNNVRMIKMILTK